MLFRDEWLSTVETQHLALVFPDMRADLAPRVRSGEWLAAVVSLAGRPIGLAVAVRQPRRLVLGSVFVVPAWRRAGVGRRLLRRILGAADQPIEITYRTNLPSRPALTALLDGASFSAPRLVSVCCEYRVADVDFAQIRRWRWRPGLSVLDWRALSSAQRDQLNADWVPAGLDPRLSEAGCEPDLSLALLHRGDVAGWFIIHRIEPDLLRCTTGYVQPLRLPSGGFALLCAEFLQRQRQACPRSRTIWTVSGSLPAFVTMLRRRFQPAGATLTEFHRRTHRPRRVANLAGEEC